MICWAAARRTPVKKGITSLANRAALQERRKMPWHVGRSLDDLIRPDQWYA
jgi:hypothetical protein